MLVGPGDVDGAVGGGDSHRGQRQVAEIVGRLQVVRQGVYGRDLDRRGEGHSVVVGPGQVLADARHVWGLCRRRQGVYEERDVHASRRCHRDLAPDLSRVRGARDDHRLAPGVAPVQRPAEHLVLRRDHGAVEAPARVDVTDVAVARSVRSCGETRAGQGVVVERDRVLVVEEEVAQVVVVVVVNHAHVRQRPGAATIGGLVHPHLPAGAHVGRRRDQDDAVGVALVVESQPDVAGREQTGCGERSIAGACRRRGVRWR